MIKISIRDVVADLPPALLKKKLDDMNIIRVTGYENYTLEVIGKLERMFREGRISSKPERDGKRIIWLNIYHKIHREGELPAIETSDQEEYYVNGQEHREDGPSTIYYSNGEHDWDDEILWSKKERRIASMTFESGKTFNVDNETITNEQQVIDYAQKVRDNFPSVGNRIWLWDWIDDIPQHKIDEFKKKYPKAFK